MRYKKIRMLRTAEDFRGYISDRKIDLSFDEQVGSGPASPLAQPYRLKDGFVIGNRFCAQPMEGWDGTREGKPTELTFRRWRHFGQSDAKLIWGGEATAICPEGRANPNQLLICEDNLYSLQRLRESLVEAHETQYGSSRDVLVGLQLTHSGRFSRPNQHDRLAPVILYHHPYLDTRLGLPADYHVLSDQEIDVLIQRFVAAAELAAAAGFGFVDIKLCHGYLGHEFLSAYTRPGSYGGSFENRTRFTREVIGGIRNRLPLLRVGVRLSAIDMPPFKIDPETGVGVPEPVGESYRYAFGGDPRAPLDYCLDETLCLISMLESAGVEMINISAGSPYYNPHIQRPAYFPPSDGYLPPEDPLVGVARLVGVTAQIKRRFPGLLLVGSAYSYLQEWLPNVAQYNVRNGLVDFVGLGRMLLSYPELPADILNGRELDHRRICRTFSDCTTAPRNGLVSGCYPLDHYYKSSPGAEQLKKIKRDFSV